MQTVNPHFFNRNIRVFGILTTMMLTLAACAPVALTGLGIGGSTGVNHAMNGVAYRTFSMPTSRIKKATLTALGRMQIQVESTRKEQSSEIIVAKTSNRNIEVSMEALSPNATRMRTVAKDGIFYDSATAAEIIYQTEKVLGNT